MTRKIPFIPGEYYHIYNRGVDKRTVFMDDRDRHRFIALLYLCNSNEQIDTDRLFKNIKNFKEIFYLKRGINLVDIGAYCLMPNHFHLLVGEKTNGGISEFMRKISIAYTMFFNIRYERSGALFQGTFKAQHASSDRYLKYLFSYIHLNPLKIIDPSWKENQHFKVTTAQSFLATYQFSSFLDYQAMVDQRYQLSILNKTAFPDYLSEAFSFESHVTDFLSGEDAISLWGRWHLPRKRDEL